MKRLRKNKGKNNIGSRILVIVLLLSMMIPLFPTMKAEAADVEYIDYRDLLDVYKRKYNVDFDTPTPKFELKIENGETHFIAPTLKEDANPYKHRSQIKPVDTIKVGQKLDVTHKSSLGSGKKFVRWDWQIYYRDENDNVYNSIISDKEKPNIPAPTKPGEIMIFLNIADDYELKGNPRHLNSSSHGNWRTEKIMDFNIPNNPDLQVKGWYFTGAKIKVEEITDIGVQHPIKVYDENNREVQFIEPNKNYKASVDVKHFLGEEIVGLDPAKNPKVKVLYTVTDIKKRFLLNKQPVQTNQILKPKKTITMPKSDNFATETGFVKVCAELDPIHRKLGYSSNPSNDGPICREIGMIKNYSMKDFQVFPKSVGFGKNDTVIKRPITFIFTISNESSPEAKMNLPSSPLVTIRDKGKIIWSGTVLVQPGKTTTKTVTVNGNIYVGNNDFEAEVNPPPRPPGETEFKPGMPDPYADNKKKTSILGVEYARCQECFKPHKRNDWREKWDWTETLGNVANGTYSYCHEYNTGKKDKNGNLITACNYETVSYQYCKTYSYKEWSEIHDYYETYQIKEVNFTSKYSKDVQGGTINLKNPGYNKEGKI
ncbi:MAG: hypothetical protein GX963_13270, partial [Bacteroidales bacterium]|nr:hypothetical protein [Bacteroidales bacterium]